MRNKLALFTSVACLAAMVATTPVMAQTGADVGQVDEVIVTARKRQESIMNVPVVTTALGQEQMERFQVQDLKSLATMVPGLTLGGSILSVGTQVSLRGVGTSALDPGVDASVSLNIDGMSLSQGLAYASGMFDVGQIEVLKGPQSLFYGKSSPGGVISLRTADPTNEFEAIAKGGYEFEAREKMLELVLSGPLNDQWKLRLAGALAEQDGFYKNPANAIPALGGKDPVERRINPSKNYKLRATLLWNPTDNFDARLKFNQVYDNTLYAGISKNRLCPDGLAPVFPGRVFVDPDDKCALNRDIYVVDLDPAAFPGIPNDGVSYNETNQTYGTLELNYRPMQGLTLTSQTGYYKSDSESLLNATISSAGAGLIYAANAFGRKQFTQEFRATSDFAGPLNFAAGAYIERGSFHDFVTIGGNTRLGAAPVLQRGDKDIDVEANSVFGQLLYKVTPQIEIAAGARWTDEKREQTAVNLITGTPVPVVMAAPKLRAKNVAPELTITYRPTDDLTLFGALKRGYKSGSYNVSTPPFTGENNAFNDEKVEGGEIGLKSRLLDRSLTFNIAGYYYKFDGLQVGANVQAAGGITVTRTVNAGKARIYGIEADAAYQPPSIEGLNIRGSINWNNSRYTELTNVPCYGGQMISEGCNLLFNPAANGGVGGFTAQDRSGVPLVRAPRWQANFGFDYEFPLSESLTLVLASNNQYSSRYLTNLGYLFYQGGFIKADATVTLKSADDRWEFAVIGKNLSNELTTGNCSNGNRFAGNAGGLITGANVRGAAGTDEVSCWMDRGREIWAKVTFRY